MGNLPFLALHSKDLLQGSHDVHPLVCLLLARREDAHGDFRVLRLGVQVLAGARDVLEKSL